MAPVRTAHGSNVRCMPRSGKPVVDRGPNAPARDRRLAWPMMAGNEQDNAVTGINRLLENAVDRAPRGVERHPVQVKHPVGLGLARAEPAVPARVESSPEPRTDWRSSRNRRQFRLACERFYVGILLFFFRRFRLNFFAR